MCAARLNHHIKRRLWKEQGTRFTDEYLSEVRRAAQEAEELPKGDDRVASLARTLSHFCGIGNTYGEVAALKTLWAAIGSAVRDGGGGAHGDLLRRLVGLVAQIAFFDNSRALHRQLLSNASRLPSPFLGHWKEATALRIREACDRSRGGALRRDAKVVGRGEGDDTLGLAREVLSISKTLMSLQCYPAFRDVLGGECLNIAMALALALGRVCRNAEDGGIVSPSIAELCQEAANVLVSVVQNHRDSMAPSMSSSMGGDGEESAVGQVALSALGVLHCQAMPRDVMTTAAVALWTLVFADPSCGGDPDVCALWATEAAFLPPEGGARVVAMSGRCQNEGDQGDESSSEVHRVLAARGTSLAAQVGGLGEFGSLCSLRGLLSALPTASFSSDLLLVEGEKRGEPWSLMLQGVLPTACRKVRESPDSHTKYHALCVLDVALRSWAQCLRSRLKGGKTGATAGRGRGEAGREDAGAAVGDEEEEGLDLGIFDEDAEDDTDENDEEDDTEEKGEAGEEGKAAAGEGEGLDGMHGALAPSDLLGLAALVSSSWEDPLSLIVRTSHSCYGSLLECHDIQCRLIGVDPLPLLKKLCDGLTAVGFHKKGIYTPLTHLSKRLGPLRTLELCPNCIRESIGTAGHANDATCTAAAGFLKHFSRTLLSEGLRSDLRAWMDTWQGPLTAALVHQGQGARQNASLYLLPIFLEADPRCLAVLLSSLLSRKNEEGLGQSEVAAAVSVLKCAKGLDLISRVEEELKCPEGECVWLDKEVPRSAIVSSLDSTRVETLELLCASWKKTSLPGRGELDLLRRAIPVELTCASMGFRSRFVTLLSKFFERILIATRSARSRRRADDRWRAEHGKGREAKEAAEDEEAELRECISFLIWLRGHLSRCLYPGAPVARRQLALDLLVAMARVFRVDGGSGGEEEGEGEFHPLEGGPLVGAGTTKVLVSNVADSWDDVRASAAGILCALPLPLPGLDTEVEVTRALCFAKSLLVSAQVRESDAGASLARVLAKRYAAELGWEMRIHPDASVTAVTNSKLGSPAGAEATLPLLRSALFLVDDQVSQAKQDLHSSCLQGLAHGGLLLCRYLLEDLQAAGAQTLRRVDCLALAREVLPRVLAATRCSAWAVSQQDELNVGAGEAEGDFSTETFSTETGEGEGEESIAPAARVIINGSWLTIKEVGAVTGRLARMLLTPGTQREDGGGRAREEVAAILERLGDNLLEILEEVKHNGASEKAHLGLTDLVGPLLETGDPKLEGMPYAWLSRLRRHALRPHQTGSDIVRRSAGLPFALVALAKAEPKGLPKKLLPLGMRTFLDIASAGPGAGAGDDGDGGGPGGRAFITTFPSAGDAGIVLNVLSYFPRVHALNMLSKVFNDSELATDTSGFYADGLKLAIRGFADERWEVRNGASQLYSTLVVRMIGFKNVWRVETSRKAITSSEFFDRFGALHAFFRVELEEATESLGACQGGGDDDDDDGGDTRVLPATLVHPSLLPILGVLSRLGGSLKEGENDALSPRRLAPLVQRCCLAQSLALRNLAADSFSPLVPPSEAPTCWRDLAQRAKALASGEERGGANALHGAARQLRVLCERNAPDLRLQDREDMVEAIAETLGDLAECCSRRLVSCPFARSEAVEAAYYAAKFALGACKNQRSKILLWESFAGMDAVTGVTGGGRGEYEFEAAVARLVVALLGHARGAGADLHGDLASRLRATALSNLRSERYEVRLATLEEVESRWDDLHSGGLDPAALHGALREAVAAEGHHGALSVALRLLGRLSRHDEEVLAEYSTPSQLREDAAVALAVALEPTHEALRSDALSCSGHLASAALRLGEATHHKEKEDEQEQDLEFLGVLSALVDLASEFAEPGRRLPLRRAACSCLFASGLARRLPSFSMRLLAWVAACTLLQDEDDALRGWCGEEVGGAIGCGGVQASVVLSRLHDHLTLEHGKDPEYRDWLLWSAATNAGSSGSCPPSAARRLFDREEDNPSRERLLSLQLALLQIVRLAGDEAQTKLRAYLRDFWGEDDNVTRGAGRAPPDPFDPDGFLHSYAVLCRAQAAVQAGLVDGNDERVVELVGWWGGEALPPLLQDLMDGVLASVEGRADGFDAFFLAR